MTGWKMKLKGAYVALITPLTEREELNSDALAQLLDHVIAGRVNGVAVLGSTGEGATLSRQIRQQVVKEAVRLIERRVLLAAGISDSSPEATVEQINAFAEAGIDVALVAPPFYYAIDQDEVKRFYEVVAERSAIPIMIYNIPHLTKIWIQPAPVAHLTKDATIIGVKDSSRSFDYTQDLVHLRDSGPDFSVLTGNDTQLLAALSAGADGTWAASLNVSPALSVGIIDAFNQGNMMEARSLQEQVVKLVALGRWGTFPAGWKAILELIGIPAGPPAWPTIPLSPEKKAQMREQLTILGIAERDGAT